MDPVFLVFALGLPTNLKVRNGNNLVGFDTLMELQNDKS